MTAARWLKISAAARVLRSFTRAVNFTISPPWNSRLSNAFVQGINSAGQIVLWRSSDGTYLLSPTPIMQPSGIITRWIPTK